MKGVASRHRDTANGDGLASWENEGGAIAVSLDAQMRSRAGFWPASILDAPLIEGRNDDLGAADTLSMLRTSLLLLLPTLGVMTVFWLLSSTDVLR